MGGSGSGASRIRRIAEQTHRIDIREWRRRGYLKGSWRFAWSWNVGGEPSGSITVATETGAITLSYTITSEPRRDVTECIQLMRRPCRFGGCRHFFTCPG